MTNEPEREVEASEGESRRESGLPGGGQGRIDQVGLSGVYPGSGPWPAGAVEIRSPASFAHGQPHDQFAWLRANEPVHWHVDPDADGFWAVTRYDDGERLGGRHHSTDRMHHELLNDPVDWRGQNLQLGLAFGLDHVLGEARRLLLGLG